jgi:formylglycine-generating enzyme required for sulfatase activity
MKRPLLPILLCGLHASLTWVSAAPRVALVIGNSRYSGLPDSRQLTSPVADAGDIAAALSSLGYTIVTGGPVTDAGRERMTTVTEQFATAAKDAEAAVFYYSGHGVQVGDDNFLLPSDTPALNGLSVLKNRTVLLRDSVMVALEEANATTKVIILDCCRDNPFSAQLAAALAQTGKSVKTKSVGEITGYGPGFYLAFATSPGSTAADGNGRRNSPFTAAMLQAMPGSSSKDIDFFFRDVKTLLPDDQVSWTNHSIKGSFIFNPKSVAPNFPKPPALMDPVPPPPVVARVAPVPPPAPSPSGLPTDSYSLMAGKVAGERKLIEVAAGVSVAFRWCPAGRFTMGSPASEKAVLKAAGIKESDYSPEVEHEVTLTKGYWLAETEVTQGQWQGVMKTSLVQQANEMLADETVYEWDGKTLRDSLSYKKGEGSRAIGVEAEKIAMYFVSWEDAEEFCSKASRHAGVRGWRVSLPTEAQWEYACRAGTTGMTYAGDFEIKGEYNAPGLDPIAWYGGNSSKGYNGEGWRMVNFKGRQYPGETAGIRKVGAKQANAWGLHDMLGNVREWCADWLEGYSVVNISDPEGLATGTHRVIRGGAWGHGAARCRAAMRLVGEPGTRFDDLGFRPALVPSS